VKTEKKYIGGIMNLCLKHKVKKLRLCGSDAEKSFNKRDNLTFQVEFEGVDLSDYLTNFMDFREHLESLFPQNINLVEFQSTEDDENKNPEQRNTLLTYERINSKVIYNIMTVKIRDNQKPH
jgi:predicted nucleotidyltransferase